ncbi:MAG: ABATE domain-containing protein [Pseudoxanthomonas sp.]
MNRTGHPSAPIRLDGGRLCLDFVNTIHDRFATDPEDYIDRPARYLEWCAFAGAIDPKELAVCGDAGADAALMKQVGDLRRQLHALLAARIDGAPPPAEAVHCLDRWLHRAWASQSFAADGRMRWRDDARDARLPLKRIALDALDLLGDASASLRRCANTTSCGWLFLDTSKNQRRRWCAMETCGTLDKMRRYRQVR